MTVLASETIKRKSQKSKFNDEFENYLKNQCLKTTFNGIEVETFSWYKKVLGLVQQTKKRIKLGNEKRIFAVKSNRHRGLDFWVA